MAGRGTENTATIKPGESSGKYFELPRTVAGDHRKGGGQYSGRACTRVCPVVRAGRQCRPEAGNPYSEKIANPLRLAAPYGRGHTPRLEACSGSGDSGPTSVRSEATTSKHYATI